MKWEGSKAALTLLGRKLGQPTAWPASDLPAKPFPPPPPRFYRGLRPSAVPARDGYFNGW